MCDAQIPREMPLSGDAFKSCRKVKVLGSRSTGHRFVRAKCGQHGRFDQDGLHFIAESVRTRGSVVYSPLNEEQRQQFRCQRYNNTRVTSLVNSSVHGPRLLRAEAAMLQLKKRLRYSSPGLAAARLLSSGPTENPVVFLDVAADGEPLGRIIIEVAS